MTDHVMMTIALTLIFVAMVGTIVVLIANNINTPPSESEHVLKPQNTFTHTTTTCSCDDGTTHMQDLALMQCFRDLTADDRLSKEVRDKAAIALLGILDDYQPDDDEDDEEDGGATVVTAPEEKAGLDPESVQVLAGKLEKYAQRLREHPEIFDNAVYSEDFPATPVRENTISLTSTGFVRDSPLTFNLQLVLWPQRLLKKEPTDDPQPL